MTEQRDKNALKTKRNAFIVNIRRAQFSRVLSDWFALLLLFGAIGDAKGFFSIQTVHII